MRFRSSDAFLACLTLALTALAPVASQAALVTQEWISKDKSKATVTLAGGEKLRLPKKGGGEVVIECKGAISCTVTVADFKNKKGRITYDDNLAGLQAATGTIDEGFGRFEIATSGDLEGLFASSVAFADLASSSGFVAQIGMPGDQLPQGGSIVYSTQWFSDTPIGVDPLSGDDIILGTFFLNSAPPLSIFQYEIIDPMVPILSATFAIGEQYIFSTGQTIDGEVAKELKTVPEPSSLLALSLGLPALVAARMLRMRRPGRRPPAQK